ncbi:hypothetical protein [Nonomuraea rhodomycinica]|nr:hypothetical protein [Nonomuraea rhodomycinica]
MENDDAFMSTPHYDVFLIVVVQVVLLLLPTVVWLTVTLLRGRR